MEAVRFGTDGIRGKAAEYPFTKNALFFLGRAIEAWLKKKYPTDIIMSIGLCYDTRESASFIKESLIAGMSGDVHVYDAGILPTPALALVLKQKAEYHAGIVISASHNHYLDNGIKLFARCGQKIEEDDERIIEEYFSFFIQDSLTQDSFVQEKLSSISLLKRGLLVSWPEAFTLYKEYLCKAVDFNTTSLSIVLDCAHGATAYIAPEIFKTLGFSCIVLGNEPNGKNINDGCGALSVETLRSAVITHGADIGFAFDGDGDRLAIINRHGLVKDGDDVLYFLSEQEPYVRSTALVGTVMTNFGLEKIVQERGKSLIRTPVGDKYIQRVLAQKNLLLGGEPSGHIIMGDYLSTGDGIMTALRVADYLQKSNNRDLDSFEKFPQSHLALAVQKKHDLSSSPFADIIDFYRQHLRDGRLLVRYSGTESILRIMTEAPSASCAEQIAHEVAQALIHYLI